MAQKSLFIAISFYRNIFLLQYLFITILCLVWIRPNGSLTEPGLILQSEPRTMAMAWRRWNPLVCSMSFLERQVNFISRSLKQFSITFWVTEHWSRMKPRSGIDGTLKKLICLSLIFLKYCFFPENEPSQKNCPLFANFEQFFWANSEFCNFNQKA